MKIAAQVMFHARLNPDRPAVAFTHATATYGQLGRGVTTACAAIRSTCICEGSNVAIEVGNPIHHLALILALELCGITSLSINSRAALIESKVQVAAILMDGQGQLETGIRSIRIDDTWFAIAPHVALDLTGGVADGQFYRIILSSGTTGYAKAIGYSPDLVGRFLLRTWLMRGESGARNISLMGFSTLGVLTPLFALVQGGLAAMAGSAEDALVLIRALAIERVGHVTPAFLAALVAACGTSTEPPPSLRAVYVAGGRVPLALAREARARLCNNLVVSYGSTEAGIMSYARLGELNEDDGAAGYVVPWVQIQAVDDAGCELGFGREGVIRVSSPDMARYVFPEVAGGQIEDADWFYTGDVGYVRADGMLVITGRAGDVLNRGGLIIAPEIIEHALEEHPLIVEAAAFSHQAPDGTDEIWAAVTLAGSGEAHSRESLANILASLRPSLAERSPDRLVHIDALPRAAGGKLKRGELRNQFAVSSADTQSSALSRSIRDLSIEVAKDPSALPRPSQ